MQKMAGATGLEPAASAVTGQRSNQLSYAPNQRKAILSQSNPKVNEKNWIRMTALFFGSLSFPSYEQKGRG